MTPELPKTIIVSEHDDPNPLLLSWLSEVLDTCTDRRKEFQDRMAKPIRIDMSQTKAAFFARLEWQTEIQVFDADGYVTLDDTRRAKISLDYGSYTGHYRSIKVQIISKTHGTIDEKRFHFKDYLPWKDRVTQWPDHEGQFEAMNVHPYGFDWYMAKPKTTRPLCAAIEAWIKLYT